jgi:hypothetical protein
MITRSVFTVCTALAVAVVLVRAQVVSEESITFWVKPG